MRPYLAVLLLASAVPPAAGCRTTHTERIAPPAAGRVEEGVAARTWEVVVDGAAVGRVVEFQARRGPEDPMFVVQNAWSQDLGMIDGLGRAWRFRPHRAEAEWLVTGTVAEGAGAILDAPGCTLREVSLERAREAALQR